MFSTFDPERETERLVEWIRQTTVNVLKREGGVIGVSGGIDSAAVLHLTVRALGPEHVVMLTLPDRDSSPESAALANEMARRLGIETLQVDLTEPLSALGCYELRDRAVRHAVSDFDPRVDKMKIVLPQDLSALNIFSVVVVKPSGHEVRRRLSAQDLNSIVAASNMKQRIRMLTLYHEAERRNFAVVGTANKNEHDLGFFVKYGDGGVDLQPIRHLFKTQVYQIARILNVPEAVLQRPPTTDTYSAECTQEEFFYRLPFETLDAIWDASERGHPAEQIAKDMELDAKQVENALFDIQRKQATTRYLRLEPLAPSVG